MNLRHLVAALLLMSPIVGSAQGPLERDSRVIRFDSLAPRYVGWPAQRPDSARCWDCNRKKQPWVAFGEWQIGMWGAWAYNKLNGDYYGDVDPRDWWKNATGRWDWDPNSFKINQLGHPAQGSTYYNGYRTNGYGFWTSSLAALAGSATWECCGEKNLPSINDLFTTWLGGTTLGEVSRRLSDLALDNRARGWERFAREAAAGAVNPIRMIDRVVRGHAWAQGSNPSDARPSWTRGAVALGPMHLASNRTAGSTTYSGAKFATRFTYGRPDSVIGKPFSHFEIDVELTNLADARLYYLRSRGSLWGRQLRADERSDWRLASFVRYDYVKNPAFELGAQSASFGVMNTRRYSNGMTLVRDYTVRAIPLAAVEDEFHPVSEAGRNYDYAYGMGLGTDLYLVKPGRGILKTNTLLTALRTAEGEASSHLLLRSEVYAQIDLNPSYGIGIGHRDQRRRSFFNSGARRDASSPEWWITVLRALPNWHY